MLIAILVVYVAISLALAVIGRRTVIGPILLFFIAMFLTPLAAGLYVLVARIESRAIVLRQP